MDTDPIFGYLAWGTDDIAYGPLEMPTLVKWIKAGRVTANSWVFRQKDQVWSKASDLDELLLASLLTYLEVVKVSQFGTVVTKGDHGDALFMVLEGELRARVIIDGKETTL